MTAFITCPMCQNEVGVHDETARAMCADIEHVDGEHLAGELQKRLDTALLSALWAVEDQAAYARWAAERGRQVPTGAEQARAAADLLRQVLNVAGRPAEPPRR